MARRLASQRQEGSGLVTRSGGRPAGDCTAVVCAEDRERGTGPSRCMAVARREPEGRFRVRTLSPVRPLRRTVDLRLGELR